MKGAEVLAALETLLRETRDDVVAVEQQIGEVDEQIESRLAEKADAIVDLAGHYLPAIDQEAVRSNHRDVRDELQNVLSRKNLELRQLNEQLERLRPQLAATDARVAELAAHLQVDREAVETKLDELDRRIQSDKKLQTLAEQALAARERLAQNEVRLEEIRREAEEKLPAYESSSLFQYLYERKFGDREYASRGLIRRLDRWVARLIDFPRAKRGYEFLRVTPELMAAEIAKRKKACERLCNQLESQRNEHKAQSGLLEIEARIAKLETEYGESIDAAEALQNQIEPVEEEVERIEGSQGPYYEQALNQLVEFLTETKTTVLKQWAESTPQPHDDEIVAQIEWLSEKSKELQTQAPQLQSQRRKLAKRVRQLQYVVRSCRRSDIDSPRCTFPPEFSIDALLERYRDERIDQHELLRRVREHREFAPTASERAAKKVGEFLDHPTVQSVMQVAAAATGQVLRQMLMPRRR